MHLHLKPLDRRIDIPRRPAAGGFFAQDVPGLDGLAKLEPDPVKRDAADRGKPKLEVGREPLALKRVTRSPHVLDHVLKVEIDEMRKQEPVMQFGAPGDEAIDHGVFPEPGDQATDQELLGQAHPGVGRHLEGPQLDEPEPPAR